MICVYGFKKGATFCSDNQDKVLAQFKKKASILGLSLQCELALADFDRDLLKDYSCIVSDRNVTIFFSRIVEPSDFII